MKKQIVAAKSITRYPIILVHGIALKDIAFFKAFGRIGKRLGAVGFTVFSARTDGFGTIENNAAQLKAFIDGVCETTGAEKVNIIAHSKGGLDAVYMLNNLGMIGRTASLTTLCTPHRGSPVASWILKAPSFVTKFIAFWINLWYRILGDKKPNALEVCKQLKRAEPEETAVLGVSPEVYCRSYSATVERIRDDFSMGFPLIISRRMEKLPTDGLVPEDSAVFGEYKGAVIDEPASHNAVVDFMSSPKKKEKIYAFYVRLCEELAELGY